MIRKFIVSSLIALPLCTAAWAEEEIEFGFGEEQCTSSCGVSHDEAAPAYSGEGQKWFCLAKDSCGNSYIPECGNTCFSHAVNEAKALCVESSEDSESCRVVSPKKFGGSCSTDRQALVRMAK